jgi:hypothetical protein
MAGIVSGKRKHYGTEQTPGRGNYDECPCGDETDTHDVT